MLEEAYWLCSAGKINQADRLVRKLLSVAPANPDVLNLASVVAHEAGRHEQALRLAERAIVVRPGVANYHANRGRTLTDLGRFELAIAAYKEALRLEPNLPGAHNGLAFALRCASQLEEAEKYAREAIRRDPQDDGLYTNLGCLLFDMGRPAEAEAHYRKALQLRRPNPEAVHNLAMAKLLAGSLREGWRDYETRWEIPPLRPRGFRQPQWMGEDLQGRTLLVHHEQGFGDSIQFCRFVPKAAETGRVVLEVARELVRLMSSLDGVAQIVPRGEALPEFDLHCPMMSLPRAFDTGLEDIPAAIPYLRARPEQVRAWQARLSRLPGPRVGVVWAAGLGIRWVHRKKSIRFERLRPLLEVPGVTFVSLQKGAAGRPVLSGVRVEDWTKELRDFADTAALIEALDLVIGIDTSVIHLAGALAKPVWVLNPHETCWRWLLDRDDSPWYPTLRLFRQSRPGDWDPVIARVAEELKRFVSGSGNA